MQRKKITAVHKKIFKESQKEENKIKKISIKIAHHHHIFIIIIIVVISITRQTISPT